MSTVLHHFQFAVHFFSIHPFEEDLHNAILDSLKDMLPKSDDIAKRVRDEIEAVINKNDDTNPQVIRRKIQSLEKEVVILRNILKETDDKAFYVGKIKLFETRLVEFNEKLETKANKEQVITDTLFINMIDYLDEIVWSVINCVIINSEKIIVELSM